MADQGRRSADLAREAMIVAAGYRVGTISSQEVQEFARRCVEVGLYSSDIDEIACSPYPVMSEVGPALERLLAERGISLPSREEGVWLLLREYVGAMAQGRIEPREGMARIEGLYHHADLGTRIETYVGDSHDLQRLLGNYYAYDDVSRASDVATLDQAIVDEARRWLAEHGEGEGASDGS